MTDDGEVAADDAISVRAPGELGYLGILYNHAPLVTTMQPGTFTWRRPSGETRSLLVGPGLLEVSHNALTLLTSTVSDAEPPAHTS